MSLKVDFKGTIWFRVKVEGISKSLQDTIERDVASGKITDPNDIYCDYDIDNECLSSEYLETTFEELTPEDNDGEPTVDAENCGYSDCTEVKIVYGLKAEDLLKEITGNNYVYSGDKDGGIFVEGDKFIAFDCKKHNSKAFVEDFDSIAEAEEWINGRNK